MATQEGTQGLTLEGIGADWRNYELELGETVRGEVLRLPQPGGFNGNRLFLQTQDAGAIAIRATAKSGHTLLERGLAAKAIDVGDVVEVEFSGWAETQNAERRYRYEEVRRV